jgi:hypothetical protein
MGKRSDFERRKNDFYSTPRAALVRLIPYLCGGVRSVAEPCAGDGAPSKSDAPGLVSFDRLLSF